MPRSPELERQLSASPNTLNPVPKARFATKAVGWLEVFSRGMEVVKTKTLKNQSVKVWGNSCHLGTSSLPKHCPGRGEGWPFAALPPSPTTGQRRRSEEKLGALGALLPPPRVYVCTLTSPSRRAGDRNCSRSRQPDGAVRRASWAVRGEGAHASVAAQRPGTRRPVGTLSPLPCRLHPPPGEQVSRVPAPTPTLCGNVPAGFHHPLPRVTHAPLPRPVSATGRTALLVRLPLLHPVTRLGEGVRRYWGGRSSLPPPLGPGSTWTWRARGGLGGSHSLQLSRG